MGHPYEKSNIKLRINKLTGDYEIKYIGFSRVFKQQAGFSPYGYVLVTRLNKAKYMLQKQI